MCLERKLQIQINLLRWLCQRCLLLVDMIIFKLQCDCSRYIGGYSHQSAYFNGAGSKYKSVRPTHGKGRSHLHDLV